MVGEYVSHMAVVGRTLEECKVGSQTNVGSIPRVSVDVSQHL